MSLWPISSDNDNHCLSVGSVKWWKCCVNIFISGVHYWSYTTSVRRCSVGPSVRSARSVEAALNFRRQCCVVTRCILVHVWWCQLIDSSSKKFHNLRVFNVLVLLLLYSKHLSTCGNFTQNNRCTVFHVCDSK